MQTETQHHRDHVSYRDEDRCANDQRRRAHMRRLLAALESHREYQVTVEKPPPQSITGDDTSKSWTRFKTYPASRNHEDRIASAFQYQRMPSFSMGAFIF
mgnify:CR=1 FL=1